MTKRVVLGLVERVTITSGTQTKTVKARIDTGATKSSIDIGLAAMLNLGPIVKKIKVRSAHGKTTRPAIHVKIELCGKEIEESFTLAERGHMTYPVLIGQDVLRKGRFLVDPLK